VTDPSDPSLGFDSHAASYEAQCAQGLTLSGESKAYFAQGRLDFLRSWWDEQGRPPPGSVIDYGCGIGDITAMLGRAFPGSRILGVDPSSACVERAALEHAGGPARFATLDELEAGEETPADLVHLNGVVHHVEPQVRERLFRSIARATAPGGVVAIFENNPLNPGTHWVMARIPFDRGAHKVPPWEARSRMRRHGIEPVATGYLFYFPSLLKALRPLERHLLRFPFGAQYGVIGERRRDEQRI